MTAFIIKRIEDCYQLFWNFIAHIPHHAQVEMSSFLVDEPNCIEKAVKITFRVAFAWSLPGVTFCEIRITSH